MTFKENNFEIVRKAISNDVLEYININIDVFTEMSLRNRPPTPLNPFPYGDIQTPESFSFYAPLYAESLLKYLKPLVSNIVDKNLVETYSYMRVYYNDAELERHVDRPSCEYSVTLCCKKTKDWPIFFETKDNIDISIELEEGDLIVYKGDLLPHWRESYEGDLHYQIFLHYVDINGKYGKMEEYDRRPCLGLSSNDRIR
jgi:hypothetical protein